MKRLFIALIFISFITSCYCPNEDRYYVPDTIEENYFFYKIPSFKAVKEIQVINAEPDKEKELGEYRHKWKVNLHDWTNISVDLFSEVLRQRGAHISDLAVKKVSLAVTNVHVRWGFSKINCSVDLNVKLGDDYWQVFHSEYIAKDLYDSCNGALLSAIASAFSDRNVLSYISSGK